MVLDNADDLDMFFTKPTSTVADSERTVSLIDYLPQSSQGLMLITTRDTRMGERLAGRNTSIPVNPMSPSEAQDLLRSRLKRPDSGDDDNLEILINALQHIPLALTQAAAFISENNLALIEYLEMLRTDDSDLQDLLDEDLGDLRRDSESQNSVIRTWKLSFDLISKQKPRAAEMLSLIAVLDRQGIPKSLLRNNKDRNVHVATALGILQAFSLISAGDGGSGYEIHRLVQLATRRWLEIQGTKEEWQKKALLVLADMFPSGKFKNWTTCENLLPHAQTVTQYENANKAYPERSAHLLRRMARFDTNQGRYEIACTRGLAAFEVRKKYSGIEHPSTLRSMATLAMIYRKQGRWDEAEKLEVQVMETRKRVLKEEHPSTLISMANLASTYCKQGRWDEAEKLQVQVMETTKRVLGEEHPDTLLSVANLASTYWDQGRWDEAEKLEVQVMETRKRVLKEEHPYTLISMANLAVTYGYQGRLDEAEKLQVQVMETTKRVLGEEHPDTLISMANLAVTYWSQGQWDEAIELIRVVVDLRTKILGANHPDTLDSVQWLNDWSRT